MEKIKEKSVDDKGSAIEKVGKFIRFEGEGEKKKY